MDKIKKHPVTYGLIISSVLIYIVTVILFSPTMTAYQAMEMGAFNPLVVLYYHEYFRLVTANFLHFGISHILINCFSLYNVGRPLETLVGTKNILIVTIVCTFTTTLLPLLNFLILGNGANTVVVGISGIICGLVGALLVVTYRFKNRLGNVYHSLVSNILIMIIISVAIPGISIDGHLGGLLGGMATMYLLLEKSRRKAINKCNLKI